MDQGLKNDPKSSILEPHQTSLGADNSVEWNLFVIVQCYMELPVAITTCVMAWGTGPL